MYPNSYAYCLDNPIYLIDKDGQEPGPGDLFKTKRKADIKYIDKIKGNGYLATPSGSLLKYSPYSKEITVISNNLPSDPKDPERKNNIIPKDIPAEKGKQKLDELHQKPNLSIPAWQQEKVHWAF